MKDQDPRTEDGQLFAQMRERKRNNAIRRRMAVSDTIRGWADRNNLEVAAYSEYAIRISSPTLKIDVFPGSKKFHNITTNERGTFKDAIVFLTTEFKK